MAAFIPRAKQQLVRRNREMDTTVAAVKNWRRVIPALDR
jgi:hypothetical protein